MEKNTDSINERAKDKIIHQYKNQVKRDAQILAIPCSLDEIGIRTHIHYSIKVE